MTHTTLLPSTATPALSIDLASVTVALIRERIAQTYAQFLENDISGMDDFVSGLSALRERLSASGWRQFIAEDIAPHPIGDLMREAPVMARAYDKPRGYAGDAPMMDLVYGNVPWAQPLTPLGAQLHRWVHDCQAGRSVQQRRELLARLIDGVALERPNARILSIACGHLREAQRSEAVRAGLIGELVALDQDAESVALVDREQGHLKVTPTKATIRRFLARPTHYGTFDFVYSAGLYDYLDDRVARTLTASMFAALRPGGTLVVANFASNLVDIGLLEAVMDWTLIYRDEDGMRRLGDAIPDEAIAEQEMFRDQAGSVVYLKIRKV
jgi:extracellular factor (EF) 3-hydroxypalmitic acid methyl ester biosynthesis protein